VSMLKKSPVFNRALAKFKKKKHYCLFE